MPAWPDKPTQIGKRTLRVDGRAKVTGAAKYTSDVQPKGCLHGMILRSKWPAAKITGINLSKALQIPGVKAAVVVREGSRTVRYYGEELAAVAGLTRQACLDALRVIEVEATPLPFVVKEKEAKKTGAAAVWENSPNLSKPKVNEKGNPDKAFSEAAAVVEDFLSTPVQLHHALETHGNTVSWTDEGVIAWASTQGIFSVREGLAGNLNVEQSKVQVISEFMGGGFGAKFGPGVEGSLAARLSKMAGAPVRIMLTRFDEALAAGNRPSSFQRVKLGASADGKLTAFELDAYGTAGIGSGSSTEGGGGGAEFPAPYIYQVPNTRVQHSGVSVNAGSARAFRAPGHPQASFGMESMMDDLAVKLGIDPVEFRIQNDPSPVRRREYELGRERCGWKEKYRKPGSSTGIVKTGIGCAGASWGGGGGGTKAEAQINPDGSVEIRCGTQDLGTGTKTVIAIIAAEVFQLRPGQITASIGDTRYPPSGGSGGSTTCASVSPAVLDTCTRALQELQTQTGIPDARGSHWLEACKKLGVNPLVVSGQWVKGLSSSGVGGVQFAEVEVDTGTGVVRVKKVTCIQDCGLVMSPLTCESQVNGGIIMGMGYALFEERIMDSESGVVLNPNFETYKLPGIADVPEIDIVLLDMPERGVIGVGEPVTIPTASAIANAVANAIGIRVPNLPITPARVLAAVAKIKAA